MAYGTSSLRGGTRVSDTAILDVARVLFRAEQLKTQKMTNGSGCVVVQSRHISVQKVSPCLRRVHMRMLLAVLLLAPFVTALHAATPQKSTASKPGSKAVAPKLDSAREPKAFRGVS